VQTGLYVNGVNAISKEKVVKGPTPTFRLFEELNYIFLGVNAPLLWTTLLAENSLHLQKSANHRVALFPNNDN
jgi:hypothetical protein